VKSKGLRWQTKGRTNEAKVVVDGPVDGLSTIVGPKHESDNSNHLCYEMYTNMYHGYCNSVTMVSMSISFYGRAVTASARRLLTMIDKEKQICFHHSSFIILCGVHCF